MCIKNHIVKKNKIKERVDRTNNNDTKKKLNKILNDKE